MSSHLERDLGLDSLARVELLLRVGSEFGRSLPEAALAEAETPQDLLRFIDRAGAERFATRRFRRRLRAARSAFPNRHDAGRSPRVACQRHPQRPHVLLYGSGGELRRVPCRDHLLWPSLLEQARRVATGLVSRGCCRGRRWR
jgi:hypothetical protein